jgi:hypothetical protein
LIVDCKSIFNFSLARQVPEMLFSMNFPKALKMPELSSYSTSQQYFCPINKAYEVALVLSAVFKTRFWNIFLTSWVLKLENKNFV